MTFTSITPNTALLSDPNTMTVSLEGVKWPVPRLAPKQNYHVVPLVLKLVPIIMASMDAAPPQDAEVPADERKTRMNIQLLSQALSEQGMMDLYTILYWGLERGHPALTRAEFDDAPIGTLDAMTAVMVVAKQTGVFRTTEVAGAPKPGEAVAAA